MEFFIPVLFMCVAATQQQPQTCNFMQGQAQYKTEKECRRSIDMQKEYMSKMLRSAKQEDFEIIEGTCINAIIDKTA